MSAHTCKTLTPGCYRCDLNRDEMQDGIDDLLLNMVTKARALVALSDNEDEVTLADDVLEMHDMLSKNHPLPAAWKPQRPCGMRVTVVGGKDDGNTYYCRQSYGHTGEC